MRQVSDFYDEPEMEWSLRSVGPHLHPGSEAATVALAEAASGCGMPAGGIILEVGSALGAPARLLARRFASRVVCIDMDPRMHRAATEGHRREGLTRVVHPVLSRTERLPVAAASCDGAWSQDALCHMDKRAVLAEVARVLRPGGVLAFTDFVARPSITAHDLATLERLWAFPSLFTIGRYVAVLELPGALRRVGCADDPARRVHLRPDGAVVLSPHICRFRYASAGLWRQTGARSSARLSRALILPGLATT